MVLWILLAVYRFRVRGFHPLWLAFPKPFCYPPAHLCSPNPGSKLPVCPLSLSLAATKEIDVSFSSSAYLDVSVQRVPGVTLCIHVTSLEVFSSRFPHSEISGSKDICSSPKLIAAYHVFHRLSVPRHPPCALSCLTFHHIVASHMMWFLLLKTGVQLSLHHSLCLNICYIRMSC